MGPATASPFPFPISASTAVRPSLHLHRSRTLSPPLHLSPSKRNWNRRKNVTWGRRNRAVSQRVVEAGDEACELVNGVEISIGEGDDGTVNAYLFTAVKNNNGTGIVLLSDVFGFDDSATMDFAYRVACNGYKFGVDVEADMAFN